MAETSICLNMIVKNEMANIQRCLASVADHIDCWVIGDTGSTDGTQDFIRSFFAERGIPGELHEFPFVNFEQARNEALDRACRSSLQFDYLLFDDADMELVVEDANFREHLDAPAYTVLQRAGISYWNTRLVRRDAGACYVGVTHEYVSVPGGGGQRLHTIWFKDHASGSNRVDKFERDIRLLGGALEAKPGNGRYQFYLAQSLRDAGRTGEAVEAYAKRAEMGGWDEEAWYARLQLARCLRRLGDDDGFLREALAAFNQRPQRAEPLYDLARYYRERGMNDASVLFSEAGIAQPLPSPERDVLFIEDFVYRFGLKEEYSICANYSRDPARKDRGFAACNWLALRREVPDGQRNLARRNLRFYAEPLSHTMPSFAVRSLDVSAPEGWVSKCASVTRDGERIVVAQVVAPGPSDGDGREASLPESVAEPKVFLLRLTPALETESAQEVETAAAAPGGVNDVRPFAWQGALWCLANGREPSRESLRRQTLARIADGPDGGTALTEARDFGLGWREGCWMPLVSADRLQFVDRYEPWRVLDDRGDVVPTTAPSIVADSFACGTQTVDFDGGKLGIVDERLGSDSDDPLHHHRFVWIDPAGALRGVSRPFCFLHRGKEVAAGLAWHPDQTRLLISYTARGEAWIATVDADEVRQQLEDVERLSCGAARLGGAEPDPVAASAGASGEPGSAIAARRPNRSGWVPERPAAGTELMVAGLAERIGPECDRINLQVNHPGHDDDGRPLVVWMHHDVDQVWVQWCKDKALVDRVRCFVFVSHWQRQRYLEAFDLPRDRCVVLHNATTVVPELRQWDPGPPWRCAYASTPFRGLSVLLDAWELLRPAARAELHIWSSMKLYREDDAPYEHLYARAEAMPGVIYHGIEPNEALREAFRGVHFLSYPSVFAETSCLAVVEAMAAGCRAIVPSLGALPETTNGFARVYPWTRDRAKHADVFAHVLADEMARPWQGRPEQSLAEQRYCAAEYDWGVRLGEWRQLIESLTAEGVANRRAAVGGAA